MLLCHNEDYTICIDKLCNGQIRYLCWHKPKTPLDAPDLTLTEGQVKKTAAKDKTEFVFHYREWVYSIERIVSQGKYKTVHIFLEISDNKDQKYTWKLKDLPLPVYLRHLASNKKL